MRQEDKTAKYIRVSSESQNSDRQKEINSNIVIYEDKMSGLIPFKERPAGKRLIRDVKLGKIDTIRIHSVDRFGRDVVSIQKQLNYFIELKVQIFVENIGMNLLNEDNSLNAIAKMIIDLLGSVASMEIQAIKERQKQGIKIAKAKGVYKGRKLGATMSNDNYLKRHKDVVSLLKDGLSVNKISKLTGKAFITVSRVENRLGLV